MSKSPSRFAQLLTTGIQRIKSVEGKKIAVIQDELGYLLGREGGSVIEYWRKEHLPLHLSDIESLGRALVERGQLDHAWLHAFLTSASHPAPEKLCDELFTPASGATTALVTVRLSALPSEDSPPSVNQVTPLQHLPWTTKQLPKPASLPPGSVMPLSRNPFFVGRDQDLLALAIALRDEQTAAISPVETAAATGLGGIGKTQLASEFVHRYGQFFPGGVFWLSFENASAISAEIAACGGAGAMELRPDFATRSLEEQVRLVQAAWQEATPRLLVFDNCEEPELVTRWRPTSGGCRILITSRRGEWDPLLNVQQLSLAVFARHESIELLRRHCPEADASILDVIAAELGDLPLALHLAGSYLFRYRRAITPEQYLANLRDPNLLRHPSLEGGGISPTAHVQHVGRTFALSYERLRPSEARDALALRLLMHMATFAPGELVWYDVLVRTLDLETGRQVDAIRADDAFARLIELGLIQDNGKKEMRIHRLVATFAQEVAPEAALAGQRKVEETIYESLQRVDQEGALVTLLPGNMHMRYVVDATQARDPLWAATLAMALGRYLGHMGDLDSAYTYFVYALGVRRAHVGEVHNDTAFTYRELGFVLREMDRFAEARVTLERAVEIYLQILGEAHTDTADALNELGLVYSYEGKVDLALATMQRAYAICEESLGQQHRLTAEVATNLGILWVDSLGAPEKGLHFLQQALDIRCKQIGEEHPFTALSYHNLGYVCEALGQFDASKSAYEHALAIRRKILGAEHCSTAFTESMLGALLTRMGQLAHAREYLEHANAAMSRALPGQHLLVAVTNTNLGLNLQASGDYVHAYHHLQRALTIREAVYDEDNLSIAKTLEYLGKLCCDQGKRAEAQRHLHRSLTIRQQLLKADHPLIERITGLLKACEQKS